MTLLDFVVILVVLLVAHFAPFIGATVWLWALGALIVERVMKGERL